MTDKEIENFVNWLQSCTAKKFYSADAEDLIFEFKNQPLSQHDVSGQVCGYCKKQLTAGVFPKWFCLRSECEMYLKSQT